MMNGLEQVSPLGRFGAEIIGFDLRCSADATEERTLRALLAQFQMLLFREQTITADDQRRFTAIFGVPEPGLERRPAPHKLAGHDDILALSNGGGSPTGDYGFGWHSDGLAYARVPHGATVLRCEACPHDSGATLFADQYAAIDRLDDILRKTVAPLYWHLPPIAFSEVPDGGFLTQPMVRRHPVTGREFLFCAPAAEQICGWSRSDSAALLRVIRQHQTAAECLYRHAWRPGDVLVWENCALLHTRADTVDYVSQGLRLMLRTATCGDFAAMECACNYGNSGGPSCHPLDRRAN